MSIKTANDLLEALKSISENKEGENPKDYRYILYVRKSTDESGKQISSLPDQIRECKEYADRNGLVIGKVFQEAISGKDAGIRPKFLEMITLLETGKFDGILAWHPDRLARNMRDAGVIIDLVDKRTIKDLRFASYSFENTASGKMNLGVTFVLSKHYSDHLSDSVSRGNKNRIAEGKYINRPKHGYIKDPNQYLIPDTHNNNFILIKNAFRMRIEGKTLEEIAKYLNDNHYSITRGNKRKGEFIRLPYKMDKQKVSSFMTDPIYVGVLKYGKNAGLNLIESYGFQPMLSVEEFMQINKLSNNKELVRLARNFHKGESVKANLMREMVMCSECNEPMTAGITSKNNKDGKTNYFYYRCDNEDCQRKGKSTRAKVVMDYIYNYLEKKPFSSPESYTHYKEEMARVSAQRLVDAKRNLNSLQGQKIRQEEKLESIKDMLAGTEGEDVKALYRDDLKPTQAHLKELGELIKKAKAYIEAGKVSILTYSEFIELMENMPKTMRNMKNMNDLDYIIKKIFLNFTATPEKVIKSTLNSPFDALETLKVSNGAFV